MHSVMCASMTLHSTRAYASPCGAKIHARIRTKLCTYSVINAMRSLPLRSNLNGSFGLCTHVYILYIICTYLVSQGRLVRPCKLVKRLVNVCKFSDGFIFTLCIYCMCVCVSRSKQCVRRTLAFRSNERSFSNDRIFFSGVFLLKRGGVGGVTSLVLVCN